MSLAANSIKTLVVKIGTNLLSGRRAFDGRVMEEGVKTLCALKHEYGFNLVLVSSGAVGCGMNTLGLEKRPTALPEKQAVAAVGQATLMHNYETLFKVYGEGLHTAQVLLTLSDLDKRENYLNVRNTLHALFEMKSIIPIINENDSTAVEELRFGDNDTLAAKIAAKINADLLVILSDIDGLYDKNPAKHADAKLVETVSRITYEIEAMAGGAGSIASTGGMRTKLEAAKIARAAGVEVIIANGYTSGILRGVLEHTARCTRFEPSHTVLPHRKRWIAFGRTMKGALRVDEGACRALVQKGKSLLAAGVVEVLGDFKVGAAVDICAPDHTVVARGLVNYDSASIQQIMGHKSREIEKILGRNDFDEVIHRNNMVVL